MSIGIKVLCFIVMVTDFLSCVGVEKREVSQEMKKFMSSEVHIPDGLVKVDGGNLNYVINLGQGPYLIIYHGNDECSTCVLTHRYMDCSYLEKVMDSGKCEVMVIFAPLEDDVDNILEYMRLMDLDIPLYVDCFGTFALNNPCLPHDRRFHAFLLDTEGHPVFVGNPMSNDSLDRLFWKALESL